MISYISIAHFGANNLMVYGLCKDLLIFKKPIIENWNQNTINEMFIMFHLNFGCSNLSNSDTQNTETYPCWDTDTLRILADIHRYSRILIRYFTDSQICILEKMKSKKV